MARSYFSRDLDQINQKSEKISLWKHCQALRLPREVRESLTLEAFKGMKMWHLRRQFSGGLDSVNTWIQ